MYGEGTVVSDPELKELPNSVSTRFNVAVPESRKGKENNDITYTHYLTFEAFDTGAKYLVENCRKGDKLVFEAQPRQNRWEDEKTGTKKSRVVFRLNKFSIIQSD